MSSTSLSKRLLSSRLVILPGELQPHLEPFRFCPIRSDRDFLVTDFSVRLRLNVCLIVHNFPRPAIFADFAARDNAGNRLRRKGLFTPGIRVLPHRSNTPCPAECTTNQFVMSKPRSQKGFNPEDTEALEASRPAIPFAEDMDRRAKSPFVMTSFGRRGKNALGWETGHTMFFSPDDPN